MPGLSLQHRQRRLVCGTRRAAIRRLTPSTRNFSRCLPKYEAIETADDATARSDYDYDRLAIGPLVCWYAEQYALFFFWTVLPTCPRRYGPRHQALIPQNCLGRLQHLPPSWLVSVLAYL